MSFQKKKGLGLVLAALIATICLMPGTAAASGGVSVSTDELDNSANVRKGSITCATTDYYGGIDLRYNRPTGVAANPFVQQMDGTFDYNTQFLLGCQPSSGTTGFGSLSLWGDFSAIASFTGGCPLNFIHETLHVWGGTVGMNASTIDVTNMTWVLAGSQFAITGSGVDQHGQQVTLSGQATSAESGWDNCQDYTRQFIDELVLTATY